jgi:hypothetical protein
LYIQDWLIATGSKSLRCPLKWLPEGPDCYTNSPHFVNVPSQSIANLAKMSVRGAAAPTGDSVFLTIGGKSYGVRNAQSDALTDLSYHWSNVQFNVFGDGNGSIARFNSGSNVAVQVQIDTGTQPVDPLCVLTYSSTEESNTLSLSNASLQPAPAAFPSIVFSESNAPQRGSASCVVLGAAP